MTAFQGIGKMLIIVGGILIIIGIVFLISPKIPFLGRLPGDFGIRGKGFSIYIPIATCIILSMLLTIILNIFFRK
jgi:hypothetical protein